MQASTGRCGTTRSRVRPTTLHYGPPRRRGRDVFGGFDMADLAYALLLIGGFALLALMLRGLDSL